jgi:hypothetical protein
MRPTPEAMLGLALLMVVTEVSMRAGLDPDGSLTAGRVLAALAMMERVGTCEAEPGAAAVERQASLALARETLARLAPLVTRLARAQALDGGMAG